MGGGVYTCEKKINKQKKKKKFVKVEKSELLSDKLNMNISGRGFVSLPPPRSTSVAIRYHIAKGSTSLVYIITVHSSSSSKAGRAPPCHSPVARAPLYVFNIFPSGRSP